MFFREGRGIEGFRGSLVGGQFGFQCANAVIFFILIAVVSIAQTKFLNSKEEQL